MVVSRFTDFFENERFELFLCDVLLIIKVEEARIKRGGIRLVAWIVIRFQIGMGQRAFDVDPRLWVECEELFQKIQCLWILPFE